MERNSNVLCPCREWQYPTTLLDQEKVLGCRNRRWTGNLAGGGRLRIYLGSSMMLTMVGDTAITVRLGLVLIP